MVACTLLVMAKNTDNYKNFLINSINPGSHSI